MLAVMLNGTKGVIPKKHRPYVLKLLHEGDFSIQRMKQLARTTVLSQKLITILLVFAGRSCTACSERQNRPYKPSIHPWMVPEKPWSRLHLDHAVNFMGSN